MSKPKIRFAISKSGERIPYQQVGVKWVRADKPVQIPMRRDTQKYDPSKTITPGTDLPLEDYRMADEGYSKLVKKYRNMPNSKNKRLLARRLRGYRKKINGQYSKEFETDLQKEQRKIAADMSLPEKLLVGSGRTVDKMAAGTGDIMDTLKGTTGAMVGSDTMMDKAGEDTIKRMEEQLGKDQVYDTFASENPVSSSVGEIAPYFTPIGIESLAAKTFGGALKGFGRGMTKVADETTSQAGRFRKTKPVAAAEKAVRSTKAGEDIVQELGRLQQSLATPFKKMGNKSPNYNIYQPDNMLNKAVGEGVRSGVEGGLHYDNNALTDAALGTGSYALGRRALRGLERAPRLYDDGDGIAETIQWAMDKGYNLPPGAVTRNPKYQAIDHRLRRGDGAEPLKAMDSDNQLIHQDILSNAIGLNKADFGIEAGAPLYLSGKNLVRISDDFGDEFETMLKNIDVNLSAGAKSDMQQLISAADSLPKDDREIAQRVLGKLIDNVESVAVMKRNPMTGRLMGKGMNGKQYEKLLHQISEQKNKALKDGHNELGEAIKMIEGKLNEGVANALDVGNSKFSGSDFKNLQERYAMYQLGLKHAGIDGKVNMSEMSKDFLNNDKFRLLTSGEDSGRAINELHKAARVQNLLDEGKEGMFARMSAEGGSVPLIQQLMSGGAKGVSKWPVIGQDAWLSNLMAKRYLSSSNNRKSWNPYTEGLLNIPGANKDWGNSESLNTLFKRFGDVGEVSSVMSREGFQGAAFDEAKSLLGLDNANMTSDEEKDLREELKKRGLLAE